MIKNKKQNKRNPPKQDEKAPKMHGVVWLPREIETEKTFWREGTIKDQDSRR